MHFRAELNLSSQEKMRKPNTNRCIRPIQNLPLQREPKIHDRIHICDRICIAELQKTSYLGDVSYQLA